MKNNKSRKLSICIAVVAVLLIIFGCLGTSSAALTYISDVWSGHVEMYDIGVSLLEEADKDSSPTIVSWRNYVPYSNAQWDEHTGELLNNMLSGDEKLVYGKEYKEELSVQNTGTIDQFVRVNVYKYWLDKDGNKVQDISPDLINLHFTNLDSNWIKDESATTKERTVLYYNQLLPTGAKSTIFTDTLTVYVDQKMINKVTQITQDGKVITTYDYNGYKFIIEAEVDAIQNHNAQDAAYSAWGKNVSISGNSLSLN